jgi:hypothetical protein
LSREVHLPAAAASFDPTLHKNIPRKNGKRSFFGFLHIDNGIQSEGNDLLLILLRLRLQKKR